MLQQTAEKTNVSDEAIPAVIGDHGEGDESSAEDEGMDQKEEIDSFRIMGEREASRLMGWSRNQGRDQCGPGLEKIASVSLPSHARVRNWTYKNPNSPIERYPGKDLPEFIILWQTT